MNLPLRFRRLVDEMQRRGIQCRQIPNTILVEARQGEAHYLFSEYVLPNIPQNYLKLIDNKKNFKALLKRMDIPYVLKSRCFLPEEQETAANYAENKIGFPVICKPIFGVSMFLVFCGIQSKKEFNHLWQQHYLPLTQSRHEVMVEQYFENASDNRFIGFKDGTKVVVKRMKPEVKGDGRSTIAQLIDMHNHQKEKDRHDIPLLDEEIQRCLQGQGLMLTSIPKKEKIISLHYATDLDKGGKYEVIDITSIHPSYWDLFYQVWDIFPQMPFFSLDVLSTDLTLPTHSNRTAINESTVGTAMPAPFYFIEGDTIDLIKNQVDILFPNTLSERLTPTPPK